MKSQTLGTLIFNAEEEVYKSSPKKVPVLSNAKCTFVFDELTEEVDESNKIPSPFETAVQNFMSLPDGWLSCLTEHLWDYYQDTVESIGAENVASISKDEILNRIEIEPDLAVSWDYDENDVYVSMESSCDWEIEHGLQITLKDGNQLAKVGPYDGHVTNSDAYDDEDFKDVIYVKRSSL